LSVVKDVFVGREKEIESFLEFLKNKDCPAFVVIGEPGIGKSSFMRKVAERLGRDEKFVVGSYEVPFSGGVANPFVGVLEKLVDDLAARSKEQVQSTLKRIAEAGRNAAIKKGDRIARAFVKDLVTKLVGKHVVEELVELKRELDETPTIHSLADEFVRERRSEFIYDFQDFLEELVKEFPDKEFVLLIDQFERAPMPSCDVFLDFVRGKHENVHVAVAVEVEKKGSERFNYVKPHLEQIGATIRELLPLSVEEISEWIRRFGKDFSYPESKRIRELSGGFPFTVSEWLKTSKEYDLHDIEAARGSYCKFVEWRIDGLKDECKLMLHRISVLLQPLSVEDLERLTGIETNHCSLFLRELKSQWIFDRYGDTFWFRHELIRFCIEQDLTESEKRKYHEAAAQFFQMKYNEGKIANKEVDFDLRLGCAYHWHFARKCKESLEHNMQLADFCFDTGKLDLAEQCYLRAIGDAETLGHDVSKIVAKVRLARVYRVWGRLGEAFETNSEVLEYSKRIGDNSNEATALLQLGMLEGDRGNYEKAIELHLQSLDICTKLGDQAGIANVLVELSVIHCQRGEFDEAKELLLQSLDIRKKHGDQAGIARILNNLAAIHTIRGECDEAFNLFRQSLDIRKKHGDQAGIAGILHNLAVIHRNKSEFDEAANLLQQSMEIRKKLGDQSGIADALLGLGAIHFDRGEYDEAVKLYQQSLDIYQKLGDQSRVADAFYNLAEIHQNKGEYNEAMNLLQQSLDIKKKLGDQWGIARMLLGIAEVLKDRGEYDEAVKLYQQSLDIFPKFGDELSASETLYGLATICQDKGEYCEALKLYEQSLEIKAKLGEQRGMALTYEQLGRLNESLNKPVIAADYYIKAFSIFQKIGDKTNAAKAKTLYEKVIKQKKQ